MRATTWAIGLLVVGGLAGCGRAEGKDEPVAPKWATNATLPQYTHPGLLPPVERSAVIAIDKQGYLRVNGGEPVGLEGLRAALRKRAEQFFYEPDGSCAVPAVLHIDHGTSWRAVQWLMQICADPRVRMYRIYLAGTHGTSGRVGGYEVQLPKDRGLAATSDFPQEYTKFKFKMFARTGDDEQASTQYREMARRVYKLLVASRDELTQQDPKALKTLRVEIVAPPPKGGAVHYGYAAGIVDAVYRAGLYSLIFEGAALPFRNLPSAEEFRVAARTTGQGLVKIRFNETRQLTPDDPPADPIPDGGFDETAVRHVMRKDETSAPIPGTSRRALAGETAEFLDEELEEMDEVVENTELVPPSDATQSPANAALSNAVNDALTWLAAHQAPDGSWKVEDLPLFDGDGRVIEGHGNSAFDVGITALALFAFLEAGIAPNSKHQFAKVTTKAARYLMALQDPEGCFGPRSTPQYIYNHAVASLAMTKLYGATMAPRYLTSVQRAQDFIALARNPYFAWRYGIKPGDNDTSVTTWMGSALHAALAINAAAKKSGKQAPLTLDASALDGIDAWLAKVTDRETGRLGYVSRGSGSARPQDQLKKFPSSKSEALTAGAVWLRQLRGKPDPMIAKGAALCAKLLPAWRNDGSIDMVYWLYGTRVMRALGGKHDQAWRSAMHTAATQNQRADGEVKTVYGSWDPAGVWGREGGRVYSTAIMAIICQALRR